jgi:hypothetical protein
MEKNMVKMEERTGSHIICHKIWFLTYFLIEDFEELTNSHMSKYSF